MEEYSLAIFVELTSVSCQKIPFWVMCLDTFTIHILLTLDVHAEYFYPLSKWNGINVFVYSSDKKARSILPKETIFW